MNPTISIAVSGNTGKIEHGKPVVILLHGYGSNENDLPSLMQFLPQNLPWYSLRAPLDSIHGGFAWAPMSTPGNPLASDIEPATARVWAWIDANLPAECPLIVIGFSQGGLMTTQLLRTRPERLLAALVLAGFTLGAEQEADAWLTEHRPKVFYARGLADQVISADTAARTLNWLKAHVDADVHSYEGLGHSIDGRVMADAAEYLAERLS